VYTKLSDSVDKDMEKTNNTNAIQHLSDWCQPAR